MSSAKRYISFGDVCEVPMRRRDRSTPQGQHLPVLLDEVLNVLDVRAGGAVVDCTTGWGGHAVEMLRRAGPKGKLVGLDLDAENLPRARERLAELGHPFALHHANFAGLATVLADEGIGCVDAVLADLGMSSMQVDDAERGFSYARDGPLDMRMDRSRGRSAAQLLATISQTELAAALRDYGDEPDADRVSALLIAARNQQPLTRTADVARVLLEATKTGRWRLHPTAEKWNTHPAARTFQALRILVNRETANLTQLLRVLPDVLKPGGRVGIISFHSGEDRLVKTAFRDGARSGVYDASSDEPLRATFAEKTRNPRSRSAKLRWAQRTGEQRQE
jgi:16S rRNA (cytosine1402-N4)-methyltransferase